MIGNGSECYYLIREFLLNTGEGILPPPPPSPVRTSVVLTPTTSGNGLMPLSTSTIFPFIHNTTHTPFSYGILVFDTNSVLTYSTLRTMGLGVVSSSAPLKGLVAGTTIPFNAIHYSRVHIPPPSPLLGDSFQ
jgi:hypothetical protein